MDKIKEKLKGGSSSSDDRTRLEKSDPNSTSSATSKYQNPISSSSGPTGTAVSDNSSSSYPQNSSGSTSTTGVPSSYQQNASGYNTTGDTNRMTGSYVNDESHIPSNTTTTSSSGPRQPFDPYSSKGQETAARAGNSPTTSRTTEDPSLMRSKDGGIMNQQSDQRYDPNASPTTSSSHNYGRDAAVAGGAGALGAGGVGAYEYNKNQPSSQPLTSGSQQPGQYQDVSYMQQPREAQDPVMSQQSSTMAGGAPGATSASAGQSVPGESPGLTQARKMGGAYEAGYRDAMEHMREEMRAKGAGSGKAI